MSTVVSSRQDETNSQSSHDPVERFEAGALSRTKLPPLLACRCKLGLLIRPESGRPRLTGIFQCPVGRVADHHTVSSSGRVYVGMGSLIGLL